MRITEMIDALLTRPAAMIAACAGIAVLSWTWREARRMRRRRAARKAAERKARHLVGQMRRCPKLRRPKDRRLAEGFGIELDAVVSEHGLSLQELGTSRAEIDRILVLVRKEAEDVPFLERLSAMQVQAREKSDARPIPLPTEFPRLAPEVQSEPTFTEADLTPSQDEPPEASSKTGDTTGPTAPRKAPAREPFTVLHSVGEEELDAYVDERFAAITAEEE
ncbi:MAG: hypothetical protein RL272_1334 [Candidatus Parcubacteria bacterium]|jgi:hypothetical protein